MVPPALLTCAARSIPDRRARVDSSRALMSVGRARCPLTRRNWLGAGGRPRTTAAASPHHASASPRRDPVGSPRGPTRWDWSWPTSDATPPPGPAGPPPASPPVPPRQALQGIVHEAEQLLAIQGELGLAAGGPDGDSGLGRPGLVGSMLFRIGSFQGGSSFLVKGKATSSLATGREEPSSLFN